MILALMTLSLNGCSNLFVEPRQGPDQGGASSGIPEGFGAVRVSFFQGAERTLIPELILESVYLEYLFAKDGEAEEAKTPEGDRFILEPGTYVLTVKAYADPEKTQLAAEGTSASFAITAGLEAAPVDLALRPIVSEGEGSLEFELQYPANATLEIFSLTRIAGEEEPIDLTSAGTASGTPVIFSGTKDAIPAGYYLLRVLLERDGEYAGKTEVAHIYGTMTAKMDPAAYTFASADFTAWLVTTAGDSGPGSLRQALEDLNALTGMAPVIRVMLPPGSVIALESALPRITKSMTVEGNGVTLTRASSWTDSSDTSQLLRISGGDTAVTVRRVHFKDGLATDYSGAVLNTGPLTLESCIFSGNRGYFGGALHTISTALTIRGCTFYGNSASYTSGVVHFGSNSTLTLTGNLFYGNAGLWNPVARMAATSPTVNASYNVADIAFGTGADNSGWAAGTGDEYSALFLLPGTFKVLQGSAAAGRLPDPLPATYPRVDFYGQPISGGGAAGAVQALTPNGYSYLNPRANNALAGSVSAVPAPDGEGLVPNGSVTVTAQETGASSAFVGWVQDGVTVSTERSYTLTVDRHASLQAVFSRVVTVNDFGDGPGSASRPTLRYALTTAQDGDIIAFSEVTPGVTAIALEGVLPEVTKSITIEGNGIILTRAASWTEVSATTHLLSFADYNAAVTIRRVHFKDGFSDYGGALYHEGPMTLESCVFSGNRAGNYGGPVGGAVFSYNTLTARGCTFYGNAAGNGGGAVYFSAPGKTLTLTGNLFYGNNENSRRDRAVHSNYDTSTINVSYNVVDADFGTANAQCGWTPAGTGDVYTATLPLSLKTFKVLSGSAAAGRLPGTLPEEYPRVDFYGHAISGGGAAGAAQAVTPGNRSYLGLSVNNSLVGEVSANPAPDDDGLVPNGPVTLTATETGSASAFVRWLQGGAPVSTDRSYDLTISGHTFIQGVFSRTVTVNDLSDDVGSASRITLRYALAAALDGDIITFSGVTPGVTKIELASALPQQIERKSVVIEGEGITLSRAPSWTANGSALTLREPAELTIRRVHFTGSLATYGVIYQYGGTLTLESCIFSNNGFRGMANDAYSGVIDSDSGVGGGELTIRGCTFYANKAGLYGGAVLYFHNSATLTLTGNLFYGNTGGHSVVRIRDGSSLPVSSYNLVDVDFGTAKGQCGWTPAGTGDATFAALSITNPIDTTTFVPVGGLQSVLPAIAPADFPATDFYGATRTFPGAPGAVAAALSP
jgi:hypothetical protein